MRTAEDILDFWFSDRVKARWFSSTPEFDAEITAQFGDTAQAMANGPHPHPTWDADADHTLALILALDQFPRNMFRGQAKAFAWDAHSRGAAERMVDKGWDLDTDVSHRAFIYMPFMHAEDLSAQNRCVELMGSRLADPNGGSMRAAISHRDVIEQFGRFPHRNKTLGRESTLEETAFLKSGGYDPS